MTTLAVKPLLRHAEMLAAMLIGMELLGSLWTSEPGWLAFAWTVVSMGAPMVLWMRYRAASAPRVIRLLGDRWPTWVALAVSFDFWQAPVVPPVWTLLLCQADYLFWGRKAPRQAPAPPAGPARGRQGLPAQGIARRHPGRAAVPAHPARARSAAADRVRHAGGGDRGRTSLSAGTVRNHLSAAVTKIGVANRTEAFQLAQDHGWL